jgi:sugar lactone lactonase YvrE
MKNKKALACTKFSIRDLIFSRNSLLPVSLLMLLILAGSISIVKAETYTPRLSFGNSYISPYGPYGVVADTTGTIHIVDNAANQIENFRGSDGSYISTWSNIQLNNPGHIDVDAQGNFYITSQNSHKVVKLNSAGTYQTSWGGQGTDSGKFNNPLGIAVDSTGTVYVTEYIGNRIQKFDSLGNFQKAWGSSGAANGKFSYPGDVAVDSAGNVYIADSGNHRIQKFDSLGNFILAWGSYGVNDGKFNWPAGIAIDYLDNVYVTDQNNARIQKFSNQGVFITKWGSSGINPDQFQIPLGITIDKAGNVYVADYAAAKVKKFGVNPPPGVSATDFEGIDKDVFQTAEPMYAKVQAGGQTVSFYVAEHKTSWIIGDSLVDVSGGRETVTLNSAGAQTIQVWYAPLTPGSYDLVLDSNSNGLFDAGDSLDQGQEVAGLFVVPEYSLGALIAFTACFAAFSTLKKIPRLKK